MYVSYNDINGHHCQYNFARSSLLWEFNLLLVVERVSHLLFKADKFQTWKIKNISGYSHKQKKGVLSVEEKVKLIRLMENGRKKADTCGLFGFTNSTIKYICKNRTKIVSTFEHNGWRIKRFRNSQRSDVDEALHKTFQQQRSENVPVSGVLFMIISVLPKC